MSSTNITTYIKFETVDKAGKPTTEDDEDKFIRWFRSQKAVTCIESTNMNREKTAISSRTFTFRGVEPNAAGALTLEEGARKFGMYSPKVYARLIHYKPVTSIKTTLDYQAVMDAYTDVANRVALSNPDKFGYGSEAVTKAQLEMIKELSKALGTNTEDITLDSAMFRKIVKAINPAFEEDDDARSKVLHKLGLGDVSYLNRLVEVGLIKSEQKTMLIDKAKECYFVKSVNENGVASVRFSTVSNTHKKPGRLVSGKFVAYRHLGDATYDRGTDDTGRSIAVVAPKPKPDAKQQSGTASIVPISARESKYTDDQERLIASFKLAKPDYSKFSKAIILKLIKDTGFGTA